MTPRHVAVIGGGLAGIAAALDLRAAGSRVTLLESRGRLGGAAFSFTRDGLLLDNGQHVFLRCCTAYLELLERIGAANLVTLQPRLRIPVLAPGGRRAVLERVRLPAPLHLAPSLLRFSHLSLSERLSAAVTMRRLGTLDRDDPALDTRTLGGWLREQRQSERAIATLWELIARPTLNLSAEAASLAQAAQVFQVGLLGDPAAADVGYAGVPLSEIHDAAARRALEHAGVAVRLRSGVRSLRPRPAGGFHLELSGGAEHDADGVVLATTHERARGLLPAEAQVPVERLGALGTSPIVNLHVMLERRVLGEPFAAAVDSPLQWIFDRTGTSGLARGQHLAVSLSAADEELPLSAPELRHRYAPALRDLFGDELAIGSFFVTREHAATFRAAPGQHALRPGPRTALPGLVLAGAWTDTGWPATMEGAVRSGHAAASALLDASSHATQPAPPSTYLPPPQAALAASAAGGAG